MTFVSLPLCFNHVTIRRTLNASSPTKLAAGLHVAVNGVVAVFRYLPRTLTRNAVQQWSTILHQQSFDLSQPLPLSVGVHLGSAQSDASMTNYTNEKDTYALFDLAYSRPSVAIVRDQISNKRLEWKHMRQPELDNASADFLALLDNEVSSKNKSSLSPSSLRLSDIT